MKHLFFSLVLALALVPQACSTSSEEPEPTVDFETAIRHSEWTAKASITEDGNIVPIYRILKFVSDKMFFEDYYIDGTPTGNNPSGATYYLFWDKGIIDAHFGQRRETWYIYQSDDNLPGMKNDWGYILYGPNEDDVFYPGNIFK